MHAAGAPKFKSLSRAAGQGLQALRVYSLRARVRV